MTTLPYVISRKALADLEHIWHYTSKKWSVDQANHYYKLIIEEFGYICQSPLSGRKIDEIRTGYRVSKVKSHLVFYKIENDVVQIIRILHQRMDIESHLG